MQLLIKKNKLPIKELIFVGLLPSFFKKLFYKLKGYKIGKNVKLSIGSVISGKNVEINDNSYIGLFTIIRAQSIIIGRHVTIGSFTYIDSEVIKIGEDARINEFVIIGGMKNPDSSLTLGKRTIIMEYSYVNTTKPVTIGNDSGVGGHCLLFTHGSWLNQLDGFPVTFAPISIGNNVWLPWRVFMMPGAEIGDNVVIGAESLVNGKIPANCLAAGTPAKIIKENYPIKITQEERFKLIESILSEFLVYLQHHNFKVSIIEKGVGFGVYVTKKAELHKMFILLKCNNLSIIEEYYDIIVLDTQQYDYAIALEKSRMLINLASKTRNGSTQLGEEFVKYLSRYGIRFDRLD